MTFQENYRRNIEVLRELYWESKRAPENNSTMEKNPYKREKLIKQTLGRTKQERREAKKEILQSIREAEIIADQKVIDDQKKVEAEKAKVSEQRKRHAKIRKDLGYEDFGAEEVYDSTLIEMDRIRDNKIILK